LNSTVTASPDPIASTRALARNNPFASNRVQGLRYRLPEGLTWEELIDRLAALGWRGALVGSHGRGKTTLLEELAPRLVAHGFQVRTITLRDDHPRLGRAEWDLLRGLREEDVLFLDGAELLGRLAWLRARWLCRRVGGIVITSHRPGLLPTLLECETTPALLAGIVRELAGETSNVEELFVRHSGNLRSALREMYDRYAGLVQEPVHHLEELLRL
jgi:hypothetical protein